MIERWGSSDQLGILTQIGATPGVVEVVCKLIRTILMLPDGHDSIEVLNSANESPLIENGGCDRKANPATGLAMTCSGSGIEGTIQS